DLRQTLRTVVNVLSSHLGVTRAMVSLIATSGDLELVAASGVMTADEFARGRFSRGEGITGRILKSGVPAVVPDVSKEPLFLNRTGSHRAAPNEVVSFVGVPIKVGRRMFGVLSSMRAHGTVATNFQRDVRYLSMVANLIGQTVKLHESVASERETLMQENSRLQKALRGKYTIDNVIGRSKRMQEVFAQVHQAAPGRASVLLRGESGTGKEAIARAIHVLSTRKDAPFVKVNCAALSETLLESELFGHEKGAFTGAIGERKGRFEQAHGGTLFLDEIGDISPAFQAKLLRVLQEREFERVGGNRTLHVDLRLITATNRNLEEMVSKGEFRADLYFRINVVCIVLPPLRERRDDIPLLAEHFLDRFNRDSGRKVSVAPGAMRILASCYWPGNVRELENCLERAATMVRSDVISEQDVPCQRDQCLSSTLWKYQDVRALSVPVVVVPHDDGGFAAAHAADGAHDTSAAGGASPRDRLVQAMERCGWVQAKAARLLNLTPRQLGYALKKHNIEVKRL
ncbi:MAG: nif-specific transcriptional activator NifA, partial [Betaproteobacteria bacterium]|nr:nif-specific transcriptional activator NifA [Betaproteobacteria bacterium]